ncbi:MAG TPA: MBL fold metallo-hydrolase [Mycobacteriales bacterium]|nr:MBL fold metallo-hydrolase [Mycobacteriales bacterium]
MASDDWTAPGVYEVVPGVYRIPLPLPNDGLRAVNVYAIAGADGPVLIDSGWAVANARDLLQAGLREIGAELGDVQRFLVTHMHRDHYSQAIHLRNEFGTRVGLGAEERWSLELVRRPGRKAAEEQVALLRALGAADIAEKMHKGNRGHHDPAEWELPDEWLTGAQVIPANGRDLEVVATPGHTRGHVVFYDTANSVLFAGDHVLPTITPSIGFEPAMTDDPLGAFLASLALVRGRPDAMLLPAHGPVVPSTHARVDELVEHHRIRLDVMRDALADGAETAADVAAVVTWTRRDRALAELDVFNQFLAVCETGAHLQLLVSQGRATMKEKDGVRYYAVA